MSKVIPLFLPFDLINVFSSITIFDLLCIVFLMYSFILRKNNIFTLNKYVVLLISVLLFMMIFIFLSGILNESAIIENILLNILFILICIKIYAVYISVRQISYKVFFDYLLIGFFIVNILSFLLVFLNIGFSSSGRFSGLFGNSNGLAAYSVLSFAYSIGYSIYRTYFVLTVLTILLSIGLIFLSVSKGAIVFSLLILCMYLFVLIKHKFLFLLSISIVLSIFLYNDMWYHILTFFLSVLSDFYPNLPLSRLQVFIDILYNFDSLSELDEGRATLNSEIFSQLSHEFRFFGYGYENSKLFTTEGLRPHNIFLSSLFELGLLPFTIIILYYIFVLSYVAKNINNSKNIVFLLLLSTILLISVKTPFYFQKGFPWIILSLAMNYQYLKWIKHKREKENI